MATNNNFMHVFTLRVKIHCKLPGELYMDHRLFTETPDKVLDCTVYQEMQELGLKEANTRVKRMKDGTSIELSESDVTTVIINHSVFKL